MEKIVLDCQKCGGALEITPDMEIFKCPYCEMPYLVERSAGSIRIVHLEKKVEALEKGQEQLKSDIALKEIQRIDNEIDNYLREKAKSTNQVVRGFCYIDETIRKYSQQQYQYLLDYKESRAKEPRLDRYVHPLEIINTLQSQIPNAGLSYTVSLPPTDGIVTYGKHQIYSRPDNKTTVGIILYTDGTIAIYPTAIGCAGLIILCLLIFGIPIAIYLYLTRNPERVRNYATQIQKVLSGDFNPILFNNEKEFNEFDKRKWRGG